MIDDGIVAYVDLHSTGDAVLSKCLELEDGRVTLPNVVKDSNRMYRLSEIGDMAFKDVGDLQSIRAPSNLRAIGYKAFSENDSLEEVLLNNELEYIGKFAFIGCKSLRSLEIPDSIIDIGEGSFMMTGLRTIAFPDKMVITGKEIIAFTEVEDLWIPEGITDIRQLMSASEYLRKICISESFDLKSLSGCFPRLKRIAVRDD